jgi:hypothetical protein
MVICTLKRLTTLNLNSIRRQKKFLIIDRICGAVHSMIADDYIAMEVNLLLKIPADLPADSPGLCR